MRQPPVPSPNSASVVSLNYSSTEYSNTKYLAVHFFHTIRVRHWVTQEIFISPELLLIKVYSAICHIGVDFVPSVYPSVGAFPELPAAFIEGVSRGASGIMKFLRSIVDLDKLHAPEIEDPKQEKDCLISALEMHLTDAIQCTLFGGSGDCYAKFTSPVIHDSMAYPAALVHLRSNRAKWVNRDPKVIGARTWTLLHHIACKIERKKFLFSLTKPSLCDLVCYSYLSVLFSLPDQFAVFDWLKESSRTSNQEEVIERLKTYLLEFDDWLWARQQEAIEDQPLIEVARSAAIGNTRNDYQSNPLPATIAAKESTSEPLSFFGSEEHRKGNIAFTAFAVGAMATVAWWKSVVVR